MLRALATLEAPDRRAAHSISVEAMRRPRRLILAAICACQLASAGPARALLLACSSVTLVLGALRAGTPTAGEAAAVLSAWLVVCVQVVAACLHWSLPRFFFVEPRDDQFRVQQPGV